MIEKLISLIGKPINDEAVKLFIDENGGKYPKKDKRSILSWESRDGLSVTLKKLGITLDFKAEGFNPNCLLVPAEKANMFYYRINKIFFDNEESESLVFNHLGVSREATRDELIAKWGEPAQSARFDDGRGFSNWFISQDAEKDINIMVHHETRDGKDRGIDFLAIEITPRSSLATLPTDEVLNVMGKVINSDEVKVLIEKYGGYYPSKDTISATQDPSKDRHYTLHLPALQAVLYFGLDEVSSKYQPVAAKKKDYFYPILNKIAFYDFIHQTSQIENVELPAGVNSRDSVEVFIEKWGQPDISADISSRILKEHRYFWKQVPIDNKNVIMSFGFHTVENWNPVVKSDYEIALKLNTEN